MGRGQARIAIGHDRSRASWTNQCHWASCLSWSNYRNRRHWWGVILKTLKLLSYEAARGICWFLRSRYLLSVLRNDFTWILSPPFNVWLCAPPEVNLFFSSYYMTFLHPLQAWSRKNDLLMWSSREAKLNLPYQVMFLRVFANSSTRKVLCIYTFRSSLMLCFHFLLSFMMNEKKNCR